MRRFIVTLVALITGLQTYCVKASVAPPIHRAWRVSATLQSGRVRLGGVIQLTLRATNVSGTSETGYADWPPWWAVWRVRAPGAVLDPIAIPLLSPPQKPVPPGHAQVWHVKFYVRKGGGKTAIEFGLRRYADRFVLKKKPGVIQRTFWRPHTPKAKIVWTKPITINFRKTPGLTARQAAGPLRVGVLLQTHTPRANTPVEATLTIKNISNRPTSFEAMSCSWNGQWTTDSDALSMELWGCHSNYPVRHVLAPGGTFRWKTKLNFRPFPHQYAFRMGFTPLRPWPRVPAHWVARTYWSAPVHVAIRPTGAGSMSSR